MKKHRIITCICSVLLAVCVIGIIPEEFLDEGIAVLRVA